jgi:hypothetical protein
MTTVEAFNDIAEVLASLAPEKVVLLKAPDSMSERVETLVNKKKTGNINEDEKIELERYLSLDLLISLSKARAKKMLAVA